MSHRHHPSISNEISHIIADLKHRNNVELRDLYNVEVQEDGQVYDLTENKLYNDATEWANHYVDVDNTGYDDIVSNKYADVEDGYFN